MKFFSSLAAYTLLALDMPFFAAAAPAADADVVAASVKTRSPYGPLAIPPPEVRQKEFDDFIAQNYDVVDGHLHRKNLTIEARSLLETRATIQNGDECRLVAYHDHIIAGSCSGRSCDNASFEDSGVKLVNHKKPSSTYKHFGEIDPGKWVHLKISGKEPIFFGAYWGYFDWYGFQWATYGIRGKEKNMLKASYCWYEKKVAFQSYIGQASCSFWCSELN